MEIFSKILATSFIIGCVCAFVVASSDNKKYKKVTDVFAVATLICFTMGMVSLLSLIWLL